MGRLAEQGAPAQHAANVTPSDTVDLANNTRYLFVGGAGNIKVTTVGGETLTITGVIAGSVLPLRVKRVFATGGTTATNMVGLY
jgi:hypothetical protein